MQIKVWDVVTRLFHWALAIAVLMSFISIKFLHDAELHVKCGAVVMTLILFRIIWGIAGPSNARFTNFVTGIPAVISYIRLPRELKAQETGHSPLAGWAVLALLLALATQVSTGLFADDEIYVTGPLAGTVSSDASSWATSIHYQNSDILLGLILLHLLANTFYYFILEINLVKPMIDGKKEVSSVDVVEERPVVAVVSLLLAIAISVFVFNR